MAYPTGSGSEILRRGTLDSLTNTSSALLFDGNDKTVKNQITNVVPALHIITVLSIIFCETAGSAESVTMYSRGSDTVSITLLMGQSIGANETFVWNDKIVLIGGDKLIVQTDATASVDVSYCYIDQNWS